jgi:hypothetical protein
VRPAFQHFSNGRGGIYPTSGGKTTTAAHGSINLCLTRSLKLNQLAEIIFAGIALAQGNQRHAIKTTRDAN